jgi:uncharacterized membrane protein
VSTEHHIRNPFEMALQQFSRVASEAGRALAVLPRSRTDGPLAIRRIDTPDLVAALKEGWQDFTAVRDDVIFVALVYPLAGLLLWQLAFSHNLLPLVFPLASGFALLGPVAAIGLYEISRRRELGMPVSWADAWGVFQSPALGAMVALAFILTALFLAWLATAWGIYALTLGPAPPTSLSSFAHDVFLTPKGWAMIVIGLGVGFVFAALALAISVVSFPMLLDRHVGVGKAMATSVRAVRANPRPMALWGAIVAASLVLGSLPALFGLIFVVPVLGHATWRLYRKVIA